MCIRDRLYSFKYKFDPSDSNKLEKLEEKFLKKLSLTKSVSESETTGNLLTISDEDKLNKSEKGDYMIISETEKGLLLNGVTLEILESNLNSRMEGSYQFKYIDRNKYDFIINLESENALLESLMSYGITAEKEKVVAKKIVLKFEE